MKLKDLFGKKDLSSMTTAKGAAIVFHFEDDNVRREMKRINLRKFEKMLQKDIARMANGTLDTGPGTKVHILVNDDTDMKVMNEQEFASWDKDPEKSWPRRKGIHVRVAVVGSGSGSEIPKEIKDLVSMVVGSNNFSGPTPEDLERFKDNKAAILVSNNAEPGSECNICLSPDCPIRQSSFDLQKFEEAVTAQG